MKYLKPFVPKDTLLDTTILFYNCYFNFYICFQKIYIFLIYDFQLFSFELEFEVNLQI